MSIGYSEWRKEQDAQFAAQQKARAEQATQPSKEVIDLVKKKLEQKATSANVQPATPQGTATPTATEAVNQQSQTEQIPLSGNNPTLQSSLPIVILSLAVVVFCIALWQGRKAQIKNRNVSHVKATKPRTRRQSFIAPIMRRLGRTANNVRSKPAAWWFLLAFLASWLIVTVSVTATEWKGSFLLGIVLVCGYAISSIFIAGFVGITIWKVLGIDKTDPDENALILIIGVVMIVAAGVFIVSWL